MKVAVIYLLLLLFGVSLSDKDEKHSVMNRAHDMQMEMGEFMKMLINGGQITKTKMIWPATNKEHNVYKFTGEHAQKIPLKYVFDMLQNWNWYIQEQAKSFLPNPPPTTEYPEGYPEEYTKFFEEVNLFEFNFGGKTETIGLQVTSIQKENGPNAIIVYDNNNKPLAYRKIFDAFQDSNQEPARIAKYILEALNQPINKQHLINWPASKVDDNLRSKMLNLAVIAETAEGARPSDEFYEIMKEASIKAHEKFAQHAAFKNWISEFSKWLVKFKYDVSDLTHENMRDYLEAVAKYESISTSPDIKPPSKKKKLLRETVHRLLFLLPDHEVSFYNDLSQKAKDDKALTDFLEKHGFDVQNFDLMPLKNAINNFNQDNTKTAKIEESLPSITLDHFKNIADTITIDVVRNNQGIKLEGFSAAVELDSQLDEMVKSELAKFKPNGRIPGAGNLARALLEEMRQGKVHSWEQFDKIFRISAKGGLRRERNNRMLFDVPDRAEERLTMARSAFEKGRVMMKEQFESFLQAEAARKATSQKVQCSKLRKKRTAAGCNQREKILDETVQWDGDHVRFNTVNDQGTIESHEIEVPVDEMATSKYFNEKTAIAKEVTEKIGIGLGVYGTLVNGLTAIEQLMNGNYGQGAFSAVQALHSIGGLTGFNAKFQRVIIRKTWNKVAEKYGFEQITEELSEPLAREAGKAGKTLARFLGDIPVVGLAFDIYFITEDIKTLTNRNDKTPEVLKIAHLVLDVDIAALSLVEAVATEVGVPELDIFIEPIIIALTIVRISIDDFYYDIQRELNRVKGAGFGTQVIAFIKGFIEGIIDFYTLGFVNQMNEMNDALEQQRKLWHNMSNPGKYFNQTLAARKGEIDLNGGVMSKYGGFLSVTLNEDGSFTMDLPEVYVGETPRSIKKTFKYAKPAKDFVLGTGKVQSPQYIHKEVKLWLLIPITSYDVVNKFLGHDSSLYGHYYGNSLDNSFYTIQRNLTGKDYTELVGHECNADKLNPTSFNKLLSSYAYDLFGHGGNDKFFLGPQAANIQGGNGKDLYHIPVTGGKTIINNFALDEKLDTLFMNVTYSDITCHRYQHDLIVSYCDTHVVKVKHWFIHGERSNYFRHINIVTKDEVVLDVVDTNVSSDGEYQVTCYPVLINKAKSKISATVDLSMETLSHVVHFIGTNFTDTVKGNGKNNQITGGLGDDTIEGEGEDTYIHNEGDGRDLINNYSNDRKNDTVVIGINFYEIRISSNQRADSLTLSGIKNIDSITMQNWFLGPEYQHTLFLSKDYVSFFVLGNKENPVKYPINIDFSKSEKGVKLNLTSESVAQGFSNEVSTEMVNDVKVILDSPHDDVIVGNIRNNILTCSGERDRLQGNSGSDTYVVKKTCKYLEIVNEDRFGSVDLLLLNCSSSDISMSTEGSHLLINWQQGQQQHATKLIDWFKSSHNQHLMVKTQDKWTFLPPENLKSFKTFIEPFQIETSENCNGGVKEYDFNQSPFHELQRFLANSSNCRFVIKGNNQNNYIDPGPSDSYGYQILTGGNGSDTYVLGHNYGVDNAIHNYATDGVYDHLLLNIIYKDIHVEQINDDIILSSISVNNSVNVSLHNYTIGDKYQHIFIHASDGIIFQVKIRDFKVSREVSLIDYSNSRFSQIISATNEDPSHAHVRGIFGSQIKENKIHGGNETMKIVGGNKNDRIIGGNFTLGENIMGLDGDDHIDGEGGDDSIAGGDGNDTIFGGDGDDDIYGGEGADKINGGNGSDTLIFSGDGSAARGVLVDLVFGIGRYGDAEGDTYASIENIDGSQFNDTLIGNERANDIRANGGNDYIIPGGGFDILQGGLDADIYDMTKSFGFKVVNNFASDKVLDAILFSNVKYKDMCYYFLGNDLHIVPSYNSSDSPGAMKRAILNQEYLEVQLLFWSGNETYRHIALMFSDAFVHPESNFTRIGRDFNTTSAELQDEKMKFLTISLTTESSIGLNLRLTSLNSSNPLPNYAQLYLIHSDQYNTTMKPLHLIYNENSAFNTTLSVTGLRSGMRQSFVVIMAICRAKATISSMLVATTLPNPPISITASAVYGGFKVNWIPPSNKTDPNVFLYSYTIQYWEVDKPNKLDIIEHDDYLNAYEVIGAHLHRNKEYMISIFSRINETVSSPSVLSKPISAGNSICQNFNSLPDHMHIKKIDLVNKNSRAYLACDKNYELNGQKYYDCNVNVPLKPVCRLIRCNAVHDSVMKAIPVHESVAYGETNIWTCYDHHELVGGGNTFSSTCGSMKKWNPPLQTCVQKPACSPYPSIPNGYTWPAFVYRDEEITFTCQDNYSREGPEKKTCVASGQSVVYSPSTPVQCIRRSCPTLLPQPNGRYTLPNGNFVDRVYYSGEVVNVQCNTGYYIRHDQYNPDKQTLTCNIEGHWSVEQEVCHTWIYFENIKQHMLDKSGTLKCQVPQWSGCSVATFARSRDLISIGCGMLGGHFKSFSEATAQLECSLKVRFEHHPPLSNGLLNVYAGRLTVEYPGGSTDTACPNKLSSLDIEKVCSKVLKGYDLKYTAKLINVGRYHTTKEFTSMSSPFTDKSQFCKQMISCRGTCDPLHVPGLACQCNKILEREACYLDCIPGSKRHGSRKRVCQSNGKWSGNPTSCDADYWKSYADHLVKHWPYLPHAHVAWHLVRHLAAEFPDVTWFAMVYDPVHGFDKHTLHYNGHYIYSHFRYYNRNFVVGRYIDAPVRYSIGLAHQLNRVAGYAADPCKHCPDPWCWFPYYAIDARVASDKIYNRFAGYRYHIKLVMVIQGCAMGISAGRQELDGTLLLEYYDGHNLWNAAEVSWDRRIAAKILTGCGISATALVMAD